MTDTEDRIARLERAIRIHTSQITALELDNARLREEIELMGKRKALPYLELVPGSDKIAQVRAELFHNKPKQGVPARVLKLFLWTCVKEQISNTPREPVNRSISTCQSQRTWFVAMGTPI